jgi:hypothetical protein
MKTTRIALLALVLTGALTGAASAATSVSAGIHIGPSGRATVDLGFFYDDLAPYGNWVQRPNYGWVWRPHAVASSWRPYQYGHWAWTDYGWTWISDEPYGWATYHYGRWYDDPDYGWEWVPGDEWAPAWVDWQAGDDYVGWAPLPPAYDVYRPSRYAGYLQPDDYVFVPETRFLAVNVFSYAAPRRDCARIYHQTRNFTSYRRYNSGFFNQGVPVSRFERRGVAVPRYRVADLRANDRHRGARIAQNRVEVFRPQVQRARVAPPPSRPIARRSVVSSPATRFDRRTQQDRQLRRQPARQGRDVRQQIQRGRQVQQQRQVQQIQRDRQIRQQRQVQQIQRGRQVRQMQQDQRLRRQVQRGRDARQQIRRDQQVRQIQQDQRLRRQVQRGRDARQQIRQQRQVQRRQQFRQQARPDRGARQQFRPQRQVQRRQQIRPQGRPDRQQGRPHGNPQQQGNRHQGGRRGHG